MGGTVTDHRLIIGALRRRIRRTLRRAADWQCLVLAAHGVVIAVDRGDPCRQYSRPAAGPLWRPPSWRRSSDGRRRHFPNRLSPPTPGPGIEGSIVPRRHNAGGAARIRIACGPLAWAMAVDTIISEGPAPPIPLIVGLMGQHRLVRRPQCGAPDHDNMRSTDARTVTSRPGNTRCLSG
jgi:hypothetical protein